MLVHQRVLFHPHQPMIPGFHGSGASASPGLAGSCCRCSSGILWKRVRHQVWSQGEVGQQYLYMIYIYIYIIPYVSIYIYDIYIYINIIIYIYKYDKCKTYRDCYLCIVWIWFHVLTTIFEYVFHMCVYIYDVWWMNSALFSHCVSVEHRSCDIIYIYTQSICILQVLYIHIHIHTTHIVFFFDTINKYIYEIRVHI